MLGQEINSSVCDRLVSAHRSLVHAPQLLGQLAQM